MANIKPLSAVALLAAVGSAHATIWTFEINATGSQVVPSSNSSGNGIGTLTYDDSNNHFTLDMVLAGVSAPGPLDITSTALFSGAPGMPGTQIDNLSVLCNWFGSNGSYTLFSPVQYILGQEHEQALLSGNVFLQITTQSRPGGEIRGQFAPVPEPASLAALGIGALLLRRKKARS